MEWEASRLADSIVPGRTALLPLLRIHVGHRIENLYVRGKRGYPGVFGAVHKVRHARGGRGI